VPVSGGEVFDMMFGRQVGVAYFNGLWHAGYWKGTPASWTDLHPFDASESTASGISGSLVVGVATINGVARAFAWDLDFGFTYDLSAELPGSWGKTAAWGVSDSGESFSVVGYGFNKATGRNEALLWTAPKHPSCYSECNRDGYLSIDDFICFQSAYALGGWYADCDSNGELSVDDFICFSTFFHIGC
jgi:hypothetical protein